MFADDLLSQASLALDHGDRLQAQKALARLLTEQPDNAAAWALMAQAQTDPRRRADCLARASQASMRVEPVNARQAPQHGFVTPPAPFPDVTQRVVAQQPQMQPEPMLPVISARTMPRDIDGRRAAIERARSAPPTVANAQVLADLGQLSAARHMLWAVIEANAADPEAWVALIDLIDDDDERRQTAREAARYHPTHTRIKALLDSGPTESALDWAEPGASPERPHKTPLEMIQERDRTNARAVSSQWFFEIWLAALLGPTKATFEEILEANNPPSMLRGMIWMALAGGVSMLVQLGVILWQQPELQVLLGQLDRNTLLIGSICLILGVWILPAVGLLLHSGAVALASIVVGGRWDWRGQAMLTAAWQAPLTLIATGILFIPIVNIIAGVVLAVYQLLLSLAATQAAQDIDGIRAFAAQILAGVILALPFCLIGFFAPALGLQAAQSLQQWAP